MRTGPLFARLEQSGDELLPLESLPAAVFLDDHVGNFVDPLVAGEPPAALEALAAPADGFAFLALARVHDLVAEMTAIGALHEPAPLRRNA